MTSVQHGPARPWFIGSLIYLKGGYLTELEARPEIIELLTVLSYS